MSKLGKDTKCLLKTIMKTSSLAFSEVSKLEGYDKSVSKSKREVKSFSATIALLSNLSTQKVQCCSLS